MDYRSNGSLYLQAQFMRGRMQPLHQENRLLVRTVGFCNLDTNQQFLWTSQGRIVRLDPRADGIPTYLNVLQQDGMDFEPVDELLPGERVRRNKPMRKLDLVPARTGLQAVRDVTLRYGTVAVVGVAVGFAFKAVAGVIVGTAAKSFVSNHFFHHDDNHTNIQAPQPTTDDLPHAHHAAQALHLDPEGHHYAAPQFAEHAAQAPHVAVHPSLVSTTVELGDITNDSAEVVNTDPSQWETSVNTSHGGK